MRNAGQIRASAKFAVFWELMGLRVGCQRQQKGEIKLSVATEVDGNGMESRDNVVFPRDKPKTARRPPPFAADGHDGCPRRRMKDEQEEEEKRIRAATHDGWMDGWGGGASVRVVDFSLSCLYSAPSSRNLPECALYYTTSFPTNE